MPPTHAQALSHLAVIIPTFNEGERITRLLKALAPLREQGAQVVVVDGQSEDGTMAALTSGVDQVLTAPRGRAAQMNAGAAAVEQEVLWFLHADSVLSPRLVSAVCRQLKDLRAWACCDVWIEGHSKNLAVIALFMNLRSRLTGIATGDQSLLVRRDAFSSVGGFRCQPLMEDVSISAALCARYGWPQRLGCRLGTSGRRWEAGGIWRTQMRMWWLRWRYWRGASPEVLAASYRPEKKG